MRRGSRRWAIRRAAGAAAGIAAVDTMGPLGATRALAGAETDIDLVEAAIGLEQRAAIAYETIAAGDQVEEEVRRAAELFAGQERDHVAALAAALEDLGGTVPDPPEPSEIPGLEDLGSERDALELAVALENEIIAGYVDAAAQLESTALLRTAAQILGADAQHLAVLRQQLGEPPAAGAFEDGA